MPISADDIPADWDDVTPEWMTAAIRTHHPDSEVRDLTLVLRDDGTNRRARFRLEYSAGGGPATVFIKAEADAHRAIHARNGNLFNEAELFASGVPLPVDHPLPYRVIIDRPRLDYVVVMEDLALRGADPRDATRPLSADQVANGLRALARLHARYHGFSADTDPALAWVQTWAPTEGFQAGLRSRVSTGIERSGDLLPAEVRRWSGDEIVGHWARFVSTLTDGGMTLLHGDAHIGNTYVLPDGDVGFLDWQVVRRGNWSQDVGYFIMGALDEDTRRANEWALLDQYLDAAGAAPGGGPDPADARLRYRASAAYGLAIWLSTLGSDGFQSREVSLILALRYARAFEELDALDALSGLGA
jgi:Phosphotransferase enzyme family